MIEIEVRTDGKSIRCRHHAGDTILATLQRSGIHLPAPCGGVGRCGKCAVAVNNEEAAGPRAPEEDRYTPEGSGTRLACKAVPRANLMVTLPDLDVYMAEDVSAKGGAIHLPSAGVPVVRTVELTLDPPDLSDQRGAHRRLADALENGGTPGSVHITLDAAALATALLDASSEPITVAGTLVNDAHGDRLVDVRDTMPEMLPAVAVDIGTTTIAAYLLDLASHRILAVRSEANLQSRFAADVVGRITAVGDGHDLTTVVREQVSGMLDRMCETAGIDRAAILASSFVGNPTMTHILLGISPETIGRAPFMPVSVEMVNMPMRDMGIETHPDARAIVAPGLSGYVGADIVADIIASGLCETSELCLLIDVGTNGEMVLGNRDGIIACSTAAGPAFEGANIRCGSGGVPGAVSEVKRVEDTLVVSTIGEVPATSICGTGLLDLVALLLRDGILDETGRLDEDAAHTHPAYVNRLISIDGEPAVRITDSGDDPQVVLTQGDIRQVQLAKGAIAAGIRTLLDEAGISASQVARVLLAGGFGTYVRPESALQTGLLPPVPAERVTAIGNAAGAGAAHLLLDLASHDVARRVAREGRYIELSGSVGFQNYFVNEMIFPDGI